MVHNNQCAPYLCAPWGKYLDENFIRMSAKAFSLPVCTQVAGGEERDARL